MGDIAEDNIDNGLRMWQDHLHGHPQFEPETCPYCEKEKSDTPTPNTD